MNIGFCEGIFRRIPIKWKIMSIIMAITTLCLVLASVGLILQERFIFRNSLVNNLSILADVIGNNSKAVLVFNDQESATKILAAFRASKHIRSASLYGADGNMFAYYVRDNIVEMFPKKRNHTNEFYFDQGVLTLSRSIVLNERAVGGLYIRSDTQELDARLRQFVYIGGLLFVSIIAVTFILSAKFQQLVTNPVKEVVDTVKEISSSRNYSVRARKATDDEIGELVDGFNAMLSEIEKRDANLQQAHREMEGHVAELNQEVAERKSAEDALKRKQAELETANKELAAFSYSVSHDLRAPLRSIDGFSLALMEDYNDELDDEGRDFLGRIRAASQRMGQLIDDLLWLSKTTRSELNRKKVDLSALAEDIAADHQRDQPERRVQIDIEPGTFVEADENLMRIVLENLVGNAWKFTGKCDVAQIEIGTMPDNGQTAYFVRDNGAGFDMAYASKLFGVFQRLHHTDDYDGTGIGLATVQRIIHRHGGRIWAESAVDKGATFYFTVC